MFLHIENPKNLALSLEAEQVLRAMFADYRRITIRREFESGLSGARVFEVRPIKADGTPELPSITKLAAVSLIQKEWQAYQQHIRHRLPNTAEVTTDPVLLPEIGWGGLRYTLMGGSGTFEVVSLHEYCRRPEVTIDHIRLVLERLFRIMHRIWGFNHASPEFNFQSSYDRLLSVNLLIKHPASSSGGDPLLITPDALPVEPLKPGTYIRLAGFALSKVDLVNQTVTLNVPQPTSFSYYIRLKSQMAHTMATYPVNQIIEPVEGEIIETRDGRLQADVQRVVGQRFTPASQNVPLPDGTGLPNPFAALSVILNESRDVKVATIHGDFNPENILIEPETGTVSLIDFAEARQDHVLHDCLCLETGIITKLMPEILYRCHLPPASTMTNFYWQLHHAAFQAGPIQPSLPHPDLEKPFAILVAMRQAARKYFFDGDDPTEFYHGLTLSLLGALKFKNPNIATATLSKQAAFWGAVAAYQFLTDLPDTLVTPSLLNPNLPQAVKRTLISPLTERPTVPDHPTSSKTMISPSDLSSSKTVGIDQDLKAVVRLFEVINQWIKTWPDDPTISKEVLIEMVTELRQEVIKGEQANPLKVERWLRSLFQIAPDIFKATVTALLQPNAGVSSSIRQIAANLQRTLGGFDPEERKGRV